MESFCSAGLHLVFCIFMTEKGAALHLHSDSSSHVFIIYIYDGADVQGEAACFPLRGTPINPKLRTLNG